MDRFDSQPVRRPGSAVLSRTLPTVGALALLLAAVAPPAAAQQLDDYPRWAAIPQISLGRIAARWEGSWTDELDQEAKLRVGPSTSPMFAVAVQHRPTASQLGFEALAGFTSSSYSFEFDDTLEQERSGKLQLIRAHAGVQYRIRPTVPGYFTAGVGTLYYRPVDRPQSNAEGTPLLDDEAQMMPSFHLGGGIDLASQGRYIRLDARVYGSRPTQSELTGPGGTLQARTMPLDVLLSFGYLFRF